MRKFYKYHGAGNDFLLADVRTEPYAPGRDEIAALCDRHCGVGSDGLMLLGTAEGYDFRMEFYNPDGSGGMMCGNGGRCITAFARDLGIAPAADGSYFFLAPDGPHKAFLLEDTGRVKTIRLGMKDVSEYRPVAFPAPASSTPSPTSSSPGPSPSFPGLSRESSPWYLDTGTRHLVVFVDDVKAVDVDRAGRALRHLPQFAPVGVNVNFVERKGPGEIAVRTFEKGVEAETLACGTGITASAIAAYLAAPGTTDSFASPGMTVKVHALRHTLGVAFIPGKTFTGVTLTGPAEKVAEILV